jgi:hypothetical protein
MESSDNGTVHAAPPITVKDLRGRGCMSTHGANLAVLIGAVMLGFVISFGFFIRLGVMPPVLLVIVSMVGVGLVAAGLLYTHDGHGALVREK